MSRDGNVCVLFHSCVYYIRGTGKGASVKLYTRCTGHVDEKIFDLAMDNKMDTDPPSDQHPPNDQQILSSQSSTPDQELADFTDQVLSIPIDKQELKQVRYSQ